MRLSLVVLALSAASCGRVHFDARCDASECFIGPWLPFGHGHAAESEQRIVWGSASGGGVSKHIMGIARTLDLRIDDPGKPVITYTAPDPDGAGFVRMFDGVTWRDVIEPCADGLRMSRHASGTVVCATSDSRVELFDGTSWVDVASPTSSVQQLTFDGDGAPLALSNENGTLTVHRYADGAWQLLGAPITPTSNRSTLTAGPDPVIAWRDSSGQLYLRRWDGVAWSELAGSASGGFAVGDFFAVTFDDAGEPIFAWAYGSLFAKRWDGAAWVELSPGSTTGTGLGETPPGHGISALSVTSRDTSLAIAWLETDSSYNGSPIGWWRQRIDGTWTARASFGVVDRGAPPVIAFDSVGRLNLATTRPVDVVNFVSTRTTLTLRYWDDGAWHEYGPEQASLASISDTPGDSYLPSLTMTDDGDAAVAWTHSSVDRHATSVYARRLVGSTWEPFDANDVIDDGISGPSGEANWYPSIALDGSSAWLMWRLDLYCLFLRRWDGSSWSEAPMGSADLGAGGVLGDCASDIAWPQVEVGPTGSVSLAWGSDYWGYNVYAASWNGTAWAPVGPDAMSMSASGLDGAFQPRIATSPDGMLYLTYRSASFLAPQVFVMRWTGSAWEDIAGSRTTGIGYGGEVDAPDIAIDALGRPWVAWQERRDGRWQIFVKMFDGSAWQPVGTASVSESTAHAMQPSIAITNENLPIVAWSDHASGFWEVYVRRWTGRSWQSLSRSGSAGGISNTDAPSYEPRIQVAGSHACVVWTEPDHDTLQVRGRCVTLPDAGDGDGM